MTCIALLSRREDTVRAAILRDGTLVHLDGDRLNRPFKLGQVYQGKISHVERGQYWVDLNSGIGLLSFDKKMPSLTVGQSIPVQISREPFFDIGQGCFKSPLLTRTVQPRQNSILDIFPALNDVDVLRIDDAELMAMIKPDLEAMYPQLNLVLSHSNVFDQYGLDEAWDMLFEAKIVLGSLNFTIEETSACTVIDVNGSGSIRTLNQQAAQLSAQQIKWCSLSGAIILEFINHAKEQRQDLIAIMKSILPPCYDIHGFTKLGFLEIGCARLRAPLSHRFI
ncbi:MAG: ribonuclease E/G [Candidatus Paracaedibacteraceae bacterium]|nr:ribonuclease E/G [Candidatus Paracaedibacteraceae bacterium]